MGLGMIADQLADLKLGELLDTPPPGLDEAVAIAKVRLVLALRAGILPKLRGLLSGVIQGATNKCNVLCKLYQS